MSQEIAEATAEPAGTTPPAGKSNRSMYRLIMALAWPVIVENLLQSMLGIVDQAMVGRLGADALAGVGTANQIMFIAFAGFGAIGIGTTVLVAQAIGAKRESEANHIIKQSLVMVALLTVVLMPLGIIFSEHAVALLGATEDVVVLGGGYLRVISEVIFVLILSFVAGAALRGAGDTRTPMIAALLANIVNAVLSYLLIFGNFGFPQLGVEGSAWAASIGRAIAAAIMIYRLWFGKSGISIAGWLGWKIDFSVVWRIMRLGLPSMVEQLLFSFGQVLLTVVAIQLGTDTYAAYRVVINLSLLSFLPGQAFATAATTLAGQSIGAGKPDEAQHAVWRTRFLAILWMTGLAGSLILLAPFAVGIFMDDPQSDVVAIGIGGLQVLMLGHPFWAMVLTTNGGLRGSGDTRFPVVTTLLGVWLIRLPVAYIAGVVFGLGLGGIMLGSVVDSIIEAFFSARRYRSGKWRKIRV